MLHKKLSVLLIAIALIGVLGGCSSNNLDYVKERAKVTWQQQGFEIIAYEGYQWGKWGIFGSDYGGANVWYALKKIDGDPKIRYTGYLQRWGDEIHVYNLITVDNIQLTNNLK